MYSTVADVKRVVKPRRIDSSKRDFGCLLIVGGSDVYSGAPALAGLAALRTGCGLVVLAAPEPVAGAIRAYSPNLIVHALSGRVITEQDLDKLSSLFLSSTALVLGPGIGQDPETKDVVPQIIELAGQRKKPLLIDADAIRALAGRQEYLRRSSPVITPHAGEFKAISGIAPPNGWKARAPLCKKFAAEHSCTVLLKGHDTVISDGRRVKINPTGNPGMAVGGMGDVLSGTIGAFLAQGTPTFEAAVAGAYVHGLAGDIVLKRKGFHMLASDLVEALPEALKKHDRVLPA